MSNVLQSIGISGTAASMAFIMSMACHVNAYGPPKPFRPPLLKVSHAPGTVGLVSVYRADGVEISDDLLDAKLASAYESFEADQVSMPTDFEQVLSEHLWDLYEA